MLAWWMAHSVGTTKRSRGPNPPTYPLLQCCEWSQVIGTIIPCNGRRRKAANAALETEKATFVTTAQETPFSTPRGHHRRPKTICYFLQTQKSRSNIAYGIGWRGCCCMASAQPTPRAARRVPDGVLPPSGKSSSAIGCSTSDGVRGGAKSIAHRGGCLGYNIIVNIIIMLIVNIIK